MINYIDFFKSYTETIISEGRYRNFINIERLAGEFPYAMCHNTGKKIVMWCINDYLAMGQNQNVIEAGIHALQSMGSGSGGTRNIGGNNSNIVKLESLIQKFHDKESALIFTSGYIANESVLSTIAKIIPDIVFFSDADNHASIIHGIRNSRAEKFIYKHLDMESLEEGLRQLDINRPKMIVFESIYSMDGLESPVESICLLAKKYNALTYIDEVHTVGLYGNNGSGIANLRGYSGEIDIIQGTLGKAIGAVGGYIAAKFDVCEAIRLAAPGFIFTTALPPSIAASAICSIEHIMSNATERNELHRKIGILRKKLDLAGINYLQNQSHIVPIIIGDPLLTKQISEMLLADHNIFVQHINYPTVKKGTERLRITITPSHTQEMIDELISSLLSVFTKLGIQPKHSEVA